MTEHGTAAIRAVGLTRVYRTGGGIHEVDLDVAPGEVLAVVGPSGSGKSTLLYLLGGLDDPDAGRVLVGGVDWRSLRSAARARFRRTACGFVTQGLSLLPQATAAENVEVPLVLAGVDPAERRRRVGEALDRVGLRDEAPKLPDELSGGQQQRVAIARALVCRPAVILADEPTGSLDSANAAAITGLLVETAAELSAAVVLVTHNAAVAERAHRTVTLHSGRFSPDRPANRPERTH
ncbi:ABC transporter ATP-binding protein [Dactylosporangium cerinum]|uniref:ABC transporter ATP-binding protein n=1 Tax=Dactylosporangium cerinum TaxID=1434730 RepID=A0ABV9W3J5_9ACTN